MNMRLKVVVLFGYLLTTTISIIAVEKIGHRGCLYEPENTASAFKKALELKVDVIKFDLWSCKTGELIVINENRIDRLVKNHKGEVKEFTLDELKTFKVLEKETFLTFQEALDCIDKKTKVFVEFKEPELEYAIAQIINDYIKNKGWRQDDFIVGSFHHSNLIRFGKLCPGVKLVASLVGDLVDYAAFAENLKDHGVVGIGTVSKYLTKEYVDDAHRRGIKIYTYAVDCEAETLRKCVELDVDAILLDYPDTLDKVLLQK